MGSKVTFIGHRNLIVKETEELLKNAIEEQIAQGRTEFMMGTHGEFDELALKACREIRETHPEIQIEVVLTSQNVIHKPDPWSWTPYKDVKTVMFDIENEHFKRRITVSNRKMIDECDVLICYVNVDAYKSGAKTAMNYAKRKGLEIINLRKQKEDLSRMKIRSNSLKRLNFGVFLQILIRRIRIRLHSPLLKSPRN